MDVKTLKFDACQKRRGHMLMDIMVKSCVYVASWMLHCSNDNLTLKISDCLPQGGETGREERKELVMI